MMLVLNDVPGVIVAFGTVLKRMSVPFVSASTIAEAKAALPLRDWTGFILDLDLPDGSGLDLLELIRENDAWRRLPAVIETANLFVEPEVERRIAMAGATLHCGALLTSEVKAICQGLLEHERRSIRP